MPEKTTDPAEQELFGNWLKEQRLNQKVSLEEIAAVTKVHISQLKMIEENDWKSLPAPAFVRGFLLCYSQHLGLDDDEVLRRYKITMGEKLQTIEATLPQGLKSVQSDSQPKVRVASTPNFQKSPGAKEAAHTRTPFMTPKRIAWIAGGLALIVLFIVLMSLGKKSDTPASESVKPENVPASETLESSETVSTSPTESLPLPTQTAQTPAATPTATSATASKNTPATATSNKVSVPTTTLELIGIEESWVIVRSAGHDPEGFSLKPKEVRHFDIESKVQLVLSNAGALELKWNGIHYESPGFRGDVRRLQIPDQIETLKVKRPTPRPAPRAPAPATTTVLPGQEPNLPGTST